MSEKTKILIVEDESLVALDLKKRLESFGHAVTGTAASSQEALSRAAEAPPDLVLMDIQLEGPVDGIETARLLHGERDVPVVFLTANADESTVRRAVEAAPHGYILKPFRDRELEISVEVAIYKHRAESEIRRLVLKLQDSLNEVKRLSGLLPICASCKKIRDDKGYWNLVETYIQEHSEARFSHGICPQCAVNLYPDVFTDKDFPGPEKS